jgi:ankyrin repeat protein
VGAAAYFGNSRLLKFIITRLEKTIYEQVNLQALESQDIRPLKTGPFSPEFEFYTPLMLAICSEHGTLETVKQLLTAGANFRIHDKINGDNIIHLSARYSAKIEIIEYLVKSLSSDLLFERNQKGETPLSIASSLKNVRM